MKQTKITILSLILILISTVAFALNVVQFQPQYYPNPTSGRPVSSGSIYVGIVDLDPEILANQKQLSIQQENGDIVEVSQPISTSAGGVPQYNGSSVTLLVDGDYSLKVLNSSDSQVYYMPSNIPDFVPVSLGKKYDCDYPTALADLGTVDLAQLNIDCDCVIASGTTVTSTQNITLNFIPPGNIDGVAGGGTETFNMLGPLIAGRYPILGENLTLGGSPIITDVLPEWTGVTGDGITDDSAANTRAINFALLVRSISYRGATYKFDSVWPSINTGITIKGSADLITEFDFSSVSSGTCMSFAQTSSVVGVFLSGLKITGPGKASSVIGVATGTGTYSCTTSHFENVNFNNFKTDYYAQSSWSNLYTKCLFNAAEQGLVGDKFNNNQFNSCDFTNDDQFWEIEQGDQIIFNNCKFQNINDGSAYTEIFASVGANVILNNPYIENIKTLDYIIVGSNSFPNIIDAFTWNGGTGPGNRTIWYIANRAQVSVFGPRVTGDGEPIAISSAISTGGSVTYLSDVTNHIVPGVSGTDRLSEDGDVVVEYYFDNNPAYQITGSAGQVQEITPDKYLNLRYGGAQNVWTFTDQGDLTPGDPYTLIYAWRKEAALTDVTWRELTAGVQDLEKSMAAVIPATTEEWETRYVSFFATGDQLQFRHNSTTRANNLQIKFAVLVKGHNFRRKPDLNMTLDLFSAAAPTSLFDWKVGQIVWETVPVSAAPPGWSCTVAGSVGVSAGTWVDMANLQ